MDLPAMPGGANAGRVGRFPTADTVDDSFDNPCPLAGRRSAARSIMNYRRLGSSDLDVSEISLGSWLTFAGGVGFEQTRRAPMPRSRPASTSSTPPMSTVAARPSRPGVRS